MPYKSQIKRLEQLVQTTDNELFNLEKTGKGDLSRITELRTKKQEYQTELRKLNRLQWDHDHNTVDYGDDH